MTSVGVTRSASIPETSTLPFSSWRRAAFSGETVRRCSSLYQSICSFVPSGMKSDEKSCRKAGMSWPHPVRMRLTMAARRSCSSAVP